MIIECFIQYVSYFLLLSLNKKYIAKIRQAIRILHAKFVILLIENSSVVTLIWSEIKVLIGVESKQMHTSPKISFKLSLRMISLS